MTSFEPLVFSAVPGEGGDRRKHEREGGDKDYSDDQNSTASSEIDSMRAVVPAPRHKRKKKRRKRLLDGMASINIQKEIEEEYDDDADSSQAVADDDEEVEAQCDGYSTSSSLDDDSQEFCDNASSSQQEPAERKFMFELVLGPESPNAVDLRLTELIRSSIREASATPQTQDDMSIDYSWPIRPLPSPLLRARSNSLPNFTVFEEPEASSDMEE